MVVSSGTHISSTIKTDRHDITVILLKITSKEIIWSSSVKYFILFSIPFNLFHISDYRLLGFTFEDIKGVIRIRISRKNRQHNGQKKKTQKDKQRSTKHTYKTNDRVTQTPLKICGALRCSEKVSSFFSTSVIHHVYLVTNPVISHE